MTQLFFVLSYDSLDISYNARVFEVNKVPEFMMIHYRTRIRVMPAVRLVLFQSDSHPVSPMYALCKVAVRAEILYIPTDVSCT